MSQEVRNFFKEFIGIIVISFILAMVLRTFVIEGRVIPTGSMIPTLQEQDKVLLNKFIFWFKEPVRGDVIVFKPPEELGQPGPFIKRVIGLPGETLEVRDGRVFINGAALKEPYIAEPPMYQYGPVEIPEDALFVMGDNRNSSLDSHVWNGWLQQDHLMGKAFMIYWPPGRMQLLERGVSME